MKITATSWPRNRVQSVETRRRDIVIRISDWTKDKDEPAYDVEVYDRGVYDWNLSESFTLWTSAGPNTRTKTEARALAILHAQKRIAEVTR